jgi:hypothetical protein
MNETQTNTQTVKSLLLKPRRFQDPLLEKPVTISPVPIYA